MCHFSNTFVVVGYNIICKTAKKTFKILGRQDVWRALHHFFPNNATFMQLMRTLTREERDRISWLAENGPPLYFEEEAIALQSAEATAVLAAMPLSDGRKLNGRRAVLNKRWH